MDDATHVLLREVEQALTDAVCALTEILGTGEFSGASASSRAALASVRQVLAESPGTVDSPLIDD